MRYVKAALKLAAETALISTVGSLFWMALGHQVVSTYASGGWEIAGGGATFWNFFIGIVQLYLLYRLVQWAIGFIIRKSDSRLLQYIPTYRNVRSRIADAFRDKPAGGRGAHVRQNPETRAGADVSSDVRRPEAQPTSSAEQRRCPSCGAPPGSIHFRNCPRNRR